MQRSQGKGVQDGGVDYQAWKKGPRPIATNTKVLSGQPRGFFIICVFSSKLCRISCPQGAGGSVNWTFVKFSEYRTASQDDLAIMQISNSYTAFILVFLKRKKNLCIFLVLDEV